MVDAPNTPNRTARDRIHRAAMRLFADRGGAGITVSELADAAGIARGTIYNNIATPENLFGDVGAALSHEMLLRTEATMRRIEDPAERICTGMRLFIRRAHEEQDWGRFLVRFALTAATLAGMMYEPPMRDIRLAIATGRFRIEADKEASLASMLTGATLAAMSAVIRGDQAWRSAGSDAAELFLRACGVDATEARRLATIELPPLLDTSQPVSPRNKKIQP
jgi:AcrR family transcriptional regulator